MRMLVVAGFSQALARVPVAEADHVVVIKTRAKARDRSLDISVISGDAFPRRSGVRT